MKREGVDFQPTIEQHAMTEGERNLVITFADLKISTRLNNY